MSKQVYIYPLVLLSTIAFGAEETLKFKKASIGFPESHGELQSHHIDSKGFSVKHNDVPHKKSTEHDPEVQDVSSDNISLFRCADTILRHDGKFFLATNVVHNSIWLTACIGHGKQALLSGQIS